MELDRDSLQLIFLFMLRNLKDFVNCALTCTKCSSVINSSNSHFWMSAVARFFPNRFDSSRLLLMNQSVIPWKLLFVSLYFEGDMDLYSSVSVEPITLILCPVFKTDDTKTSMRKVAPQLTFKDMTMIPVYAILDSTRDDYILGKYAFLHEGIQGASVSGDVVDEEAFLRTQQRSPGFYDEDTWHKYRQWCFRKIFFEVQEHEIVIEPSHLQNLTLADVHHWSDEKFAEGNLDKTAAFCIHSSDDVLKVLGDGECWKSRDNKQDDFDSDYYSTLVFSSPNIEIRKLYLLRRERESLAHTILYVAYQIIENKSSAEPIVTRFSLPASKRFATKYWSQDRTFSRMYNNQSETISYVDANSLDLISLVLTKFELVPDYFII